jgi:hypothetical protein
VYNKITVRAKGETLEIIVAIVLVALIAVWWVVEGNG